MSAETNDVVYFNRADNNWLDLTRRWQELVKYRYLLKNLVVRDIKARYKNSIFGILWSLLNPLALMMVFAILFTVLRESNTRQYPVFILVGIMPWQFFAGALSSGTMAILGNTPLVKKVYFPRELLPLASLLSNLVNFLIAFVVLVVFLYIFKLGITVHALWVPVILLTQLIFTLGLTLLLSAITVFYRDLMLVLNVVLTAWFFLTPVFYSFDFFGDTAVFLGITFDPRQVMRWLNPMASIIDGYRTVLWGTVGSDGPVGNDPIFILRTFVTSVVVFVIGYGVFLRFEHLFGEKL
ncbi:MAG: ABC transporter permease [Ardenticatenaceae bacterium]|nr:ABC transporter permease [Ardenticatenaceae bacterium]